jgi:hypothetical protein
MTTDTATGARAALLVAIVVSIGASAQAQPATQQRSPIAYVEPAPPPISPVDMPNYCVYENRVYSLGSGMCIGRTPYVCVPSPGPSTGNRAYWASKEDQVFLRPNCS